MSKLVSILKDRRFITVIGLISLVCLIWFAGPYIRFGESSYTPLESSPSRLVFIIIILMIWGLNNLRHQYATNKKNNEFI